MNHYVLEMPAGIYRIYLEEVDAGKNAVTCLASITFDFVIEDNWFNKAELALQSIYDL